MCFALVDMFISILFVCLFVYLSETRHRHRKAKPPSDYDNTDSSSTCSLTTINEATATDEDPTTTTTTTTSPLQQQQQKERQKEKQKQKKQKKVAENRSNKSCDSSVAADDDFVNIDLSSIDLQKDVVGGASDRGERPHPETSTPTSQG